MTEIIPSKSLTFNAAPKAEKGAFLMKAKLKALLSTKEFGMTPASSGKVRDKFDLGKSLVFVTTDRVSAFDVIMKTGIPDKGRVLTGLSMFWFKMLEGIAPNHIISPEDASAFENDFSRPELVGRTMFCKKAEVIPIEAIVRGHLAGSGWKEYQKSSTVCGIPLPAGLKQCDKLPQPIFTPSTKAKEGHDQNVSFEESCRIVSQWILEKGEGEKKKISECSPTGNAIVIARGIMEIIQEKSIELYKRASGYAAERGIIIADTKFEWGGVDEGLVIVDEILTPDSSRFWPADTYKPGRDQESFDKQFVRNYLESIKFDKSGSGVELPDEVVEITRQKYIEAFERLTGKKFDIQ